MTSDQWLNYRKSAEWKLLREYILERIEGNRDLLETAENSEERAGESNEFIRGRNAEARLFIAAVENDQLLLADIEVEASQPL